MISTIKTKSALSFAWASAMVANVLNWIFNILLNRWLPLGEYAQISSIINSLVILSTLALALQYAVTKCIPESQPSSRPRYLHASLFLSLMVGLALAAVSFVFSPFWQSFLHLELSWGLVAAVSFTFIGMFALGWSRGVLYGLRSYYVVGAVLMVESVIKLTAVLIHPFIPLPLFSLSLLSIPLSLLITYLVSLWLPGISVVFNTFSQFDFVWFKRLLQFSSAAFFTTVTAQMLLFTDLILVKHFFSSEIAGVYATLSLIGKMIFFFTTSIVAFITPEVSHKLTSRTSPVGVLKKSVVFTLSVGLMGTAVFSLFPHQTLDLFLDPKKVLLAIPYIGVYGATVTLISLLVVVSAYYVVVGFRRFLWSIVGGIICQLILISLFHQSLAQMVSIMAGIAVLVLFFVACLLYWERKNNSALPGISSPLPAPPPSSPVPNSLGTSG